MLRLFGSMVIAVLMAFADFCVRRLRGSGPPRSIPKIGVQNYVYDFKLSGNTLTGTAKSDFGETEIAEGKVDGDDVAFVENLKFQGEPLRIEYKGKISGDEIKFTRKVADLATEELVAKRSK